MIYIEKNNKWVAIAVSVVVAIVLVLVTHISVAQAETSYEITNCYSGTFTDLLRSEELTILTTDVKGIAVSNHENKIFNNCSFHTTQIIQIMNGKWKRSGYTKFMDPDGDYFFVEISGEKSAAVKFLYGTGKWKGITGTGKYERIASGKAIEPGTFQGCVRNTGTFELQK